MSTRNGYDKIKVLAEDMCYKAGCCNTCPSGSGWGNGLCETRRQLRDLYQDGVQAGRAAALKDILKRLFAFAGSNDYAEELHEFIVGEDEAPYPVRYIAIDTLRKLIKKEFGVEL